MGKKGGRADLSILRIIATMGVVFGHTCNTLTANPKAFSLTESQIHYYTACHIVFHWTVPAFMMITGILLLRQDRNLTIKDVLLKNCKRILLALFLFGVPYSIMEMMMHEKTFKVNMLWQAFINVINGKSWGHLWYLYALLGVYLLLPLLKVFTDHCSKEALLYSVIVCGIFTFVVPVINLSGLTVAFVFPLTSNFVFYVLLGCYFGRYDIKLNKALSVAAIALGFLVLIILSFTGWSGLETITGLMNICITIGFYSLIKGATVKNNERIWKIDRLCFGVYLVHPFFINLVYKWFKFTPVKFDGNILAIICFGAFFVILSFALSWLLSLIKPLKKYVL